MNKKEVERLAELYFEKTVDLFLHNFNVNRIAFRQIDSLLTMREVYAIKQWIHSGKIFHIIRDHPDHSETPIVYDFWGVHGTGITKLKQIYGQLDVFFIFCFLENILIQ